MASTLDEVMMLFAESFPDARISFALSQIISAFSELSGSVIPKYLASSRLVQW